MKAFYDQIVHNVANDLLKKLGGGRVSEVRFDALQDIPGKGWDTTETPGPQTTAPRVQPGFTITDAMREKAAGGLPLFSKQEPFATRQQANMASLKTPGFVAVSHDNGSWLLGPRPRPYTAQERSDAQPRIDALNTSLGKWGIAPAEVLSDAPTPELAWGRGVARALGYDVTFIEPNRDFSGVAF